MKSLDRLFRHDGPEILPEEKEQDDYENLFPTTLWRMQHPFRP
jgi:hypothetical protein